MIVGRAQLEIEGHTIVLEPGDSWVVPVGATHSYTTPEAFTAVEATSPPTQTDGRDEKGARGGAESDAIT
jgi:mannose-6-phosphate isomerase-like protein (cupin superfamily)